MEKKTFKEVAKQLSISKSALRYYDQIDLVKPDREPNGYRIYNKQAIQMLQLLNNFESMAVQVISPMKSCLTKEQQSSLPANVHLYDWLPALKVQNLVAASVLHGGEGTLQTACTSGKPFIGVALQKEQEYNINCCVRYGNAIAMKQRKLTNKKQFKAKVKHLLETPNYQTNAEKLQVEIQKIDGAKLAAKAIFDFLKFP